MNRLLRTAFAVSLAYIFLTLLSVMAAGAGMPFAAFACLYFGVVLFLLPKALPKLDRMGPLFAVLGTLLALLGFAVLKLYRCTIPHYIAHGLGAAAAGIFISTLRHRTTNAAFAAKFRFSIVLILALIASLYAAVLIGFTEDLAVPVRKASVRLAIDSAVPVTIMMLVTGVLLLRGLRALEGTVNEKDFNRRQLRDTLIFASFVSVVFIARPLFLKGVVLFMNGVVHPFWQFVLRMINALMAFIAKLGPKYNEAPHIEITPGPSDPAPLPAASFEPNQEPENYMIDENTELKFYKLFLYIFLAAAAAVLLFFLIRELIKLIKRLRRRGISRGRGYPNEIREKLDDEEAVQKHEKPKKHGEPRTRIRYLYREFLHHLRKRKISIEPFDTCAKINERAKPALHADEEELSEFRELYENARYHGNEAPTDEDAARMKALYENLKKPR